MFEIYTDGSCYPNPGPGGRCAIVIDKRVTSDEIFTEEILKGGFDKTTNNEMETMAFLAGIEYVTEKYGYEQSIKLYTDSQYVICGIKRIDKGEMLKTNYHLREQVARIMYRQKIKHEWVRGHTGNINNEKCDVIAKAERLGLNLAAL